MEIDVASILESGLVLMAWTGARLHHRVELLDTSVRAADTAWIGWDRWNAVPAEQRQGDATVCPESVIELRSKCDALNALQTKMQMWLANGVERASLIDPIRKWSRCIGMAKPQKSIKLQLRCREQAPFAGLNWR